MCTFHTRLWRYLCTTTVLMLYLQLPRNKRRSMDISIKIIYMFSFICAIEHLEKLCVKTFLIFAHIRIISYLNIKQILTYCWDCWDIPLTMLGKLHIPDSSWNVATGWTVPHSDPIIASNKHFRLKNKQTSTHYKIRKTRGNGNDVNMCELFDFYLDRDIIYIFISSLLMSSSPLFCVV